MIDRESIYTALLARLRSIGAFKTIARRPLPPSELLPEMQPALFTEEVSEHAQPRPRGMPTRWTLAVDLGIYYHQESQHWAASPSHTPATTLNGLIAAVENALAPDPASGMQTLGGTVSHCWIEGEVLKSPAYLQAQGAAIVPVKILAVA